VVFDHLSSQSGQTAIERTPWLSLDPLINRLFVGVSG
jgi:hypothetical protein